MAGPTRNGKLHGEVSAWRADGTIEWRGRFRDGARHGLFVFYDPARTIVRQVVYQEERIVWSSTDSLAEPPAEFAAVLEPPAPEDDSRHDVSPPMFVQADPQHGRSGADARLEVAMAAETDGAVLRFAGGGELFWRDLGGYARVVSAAHAGETSEETAGKTVLEAGGLRRWRIGDHLVLLRGGLFAPVANDDLESFVAERRVAFAHVRDTAYYLPRVVGARSGGSIESRMGSMFMRGDLGIDYAQTTAGDDDVPRLAGSDLVARASLGGGVVAGPVIAGAELAGAMTYRDAIDPPVTTAVSLHLPRSRWLAYLSVLLPLTDDVGDAMGFSLGLRVQEEWTSPRSDSGSLVSRAD